MHSIGGHKSHPIVGKCNHEGNIWILPKILGLSVLRISEDIETEWIWSWGNRIDHSSRVWTSMRVHHTDDSKALLPQLFLDILEGLSFHLSSTNDKLSSNPI